MSTSGHRRRQIKGDRSRNSVPEECCNSIPRYQGDPLPPADQLACLDLNLQRNQTSSDEEGWETAQRAYEDMANEPGAQDEDNYTVITQGHSPNSAISTSKDAISQTPGQSSIGTEALQGSYTPSTNSGKAPEQITPSHDVECACGTNENLCGIIFWPKEPPPKDGKITEQRKSSSRKSGSSRNIPTSSKSKGNTLHSTGTSGGCGPVWGPGITPVPPPRKPDPNAVSGEKMNDYPKRREEWDAEYDVWKNITCPCGWGYFNFEGIWIDGARVRKGSAPSNPLWAENSGRAPQNIREMKFLGGRRNLFERGCSES